MKKDTALDITVLCDSVDLPAEFLDKNGQQVMSLPRFRENFLDTESSISMNSVALVTSTKSDALDVVDEVVYDIWKMSPLTVVKYVNSDNLSLTSNEKKQNDYLVSFDFVEEVREYSFVLIPKSEKKFSVVGMDNEGVYIHTHQGFLKFLKYKEINLVNMQGFASKRYFEKYYNVRQDKYFSTTLIETFRLENEFCKVCNLDKPKGAGVYINNESIMVNTGSKVLVGKLDENGNHLSGKRLSFLEASAKELFVKSNRNITFEFQKMTSVEKAELLDYFSNTFRWKDPCHGIALLGWVLLAPLTGSLSWYPNLHVTGPSGAGKTTVSSVVNNLLGDFVMNLSCNTTEAGIRSLMNNQYLSIKIDEFEIEEESDLRSVNSILRTLREATQASDNTIVKGSSNGSAMQYNLNFGSFFMGITFPFTNVADMNRFICIELVNSKIKEIHKTNDFDTQTKRLFTEENGKKFRGCVVVNAGKTLKNIPVFVKAITERTGVSRHGDVHGPVHAAVYTFIHDRIATEDDAQEWITQHNALSLISESESTENMCLSAILGSSVRYPVDYGFNTTLRNEEVLLAEAIRNSYTKAKRRFSIDDEFIRRYGIKIYGGEDELGIIVSNTSPSLGKLLKDTPWSVNWGKQLERIPGATKVEATTFAPGMKSRGVRIPLGEVINFDDKS